MPTCTSSLFAEFSDYPESLLVCWWRKEPPSLFFFVNKQFSPRPLPTLFYRWTVFLPRRPFFFFDFPLLSDCPMVAEFSSTCLPPLATERLPAGVPHWIFRPALFSPASFTKEQVLYNESPHTSLPPNPRTKRNTPCAISQRRPSPSEQPEDL